MQFRTELTPDRLPVQMQLTDRIVTVGSCFAEVMGSRLADCKLTVLTNPLGTLFNPFSMGKLLHLALTGGAPDETLYLQRDGVWLHYDFHSSFWARSKETLTELLQVCLAEVGTALRQANWLLLTLGSAVVYTHLETGRVVANCHKMPGSLFSKSLCLIDPVRNELAQLITLLGEHNSRLQIVLTVSPVRHIRNGLTLNSASKALLRTLCAEAAGTSTRPESAGTYPNVHYFPAYELVQDDLRDYRFYEADLIHPNAQAHDYVFAKFAESAFTPDLRAFVDQWAQIRRALAHRPLHGQTNAHQRFLQQLLQQIDALPPIIDTAAERAEILNRLASNEFDV